MAVRGEQPEDDGEDGADLPSKPGPPNRGRHRDPAPRAHGLGRRRSTTARHDRRPHTGRPGT
ncbi:hypothetical protein [Phytohabitans houttuyneae]|uniref:Uncharacterized protein n=1 Tax=Phytohabitans houttuyneae TaxID=1076126 RepID=A0A6V8KM20_9ACTN|nr:hypothetical protein [Phytohabitans houttuyneae]GFJ82996.1 hypothetical protein Phou_071760 [Phytohabitans houttuyneae]